MTSVESISISRTIVANRFYTASSDWWLTLVAVHVVTTCSLTLVSATTTPSHTGIVSESANGGTHPLLNIQDVHMAGQQAMLLYTPIQDSSVQVHHGEGVGCTGRRWSASGVWWWPGPWEESNQQMQISLHSVSVRHWRALTASMYLSHTFVWTYMYPPSIIMSTSSVSGAISLISTSYKELYLALPSG